MASHLIYVDDGYDITAISISKDSKLSEILSRILPPEKHSFYQIENAASNEILSPETTVQNAQLLDYSMVLLRKISKEVSSHSDSNNFDQKDDVAMSPNLITMQNMSLFKRTRQIIANAKPAEIEITAAIIGATATLVAAIIGFLALVVISQ